MGRRLGLLAHIAAFDFFESIRSKKALALLALYCLGSIAAMTLFVNVALAFESTMADVLSVGQTDSTGAMTEEIMRTREMRQFFEQAVGDKEIAAALVRIPPLALFYGWIAITFIPLLVTLTSGDAIPTELASGSARYALFRVDRLTWALGKFLGQGVLMSAGILGGAICAVLIDWILVTSSHRGLTVLWLFRLSGRAWVYGFAYLGLAVGLSLFTRSVNAARAITFVALFAVGIGGNLLEIDWTLRHFPFLAPTLSTLFPQGHDLDVWRVTFLDRMPGMVMLLALGLCYFSAGYLWFSRRDP